MKQFRGLLVGLLAVATLSGGMFTDLAAFEAQDSPALQKLTVGKTVAIYSKDKNKYLRLEDDKFLKATGTNVEDPRCLFTIVRDPGVPNWIGFESALVGGNRLQNAMEDAAQRLCRFENRNFGSWERWALVPDAATPAGSLDGVRLRNFASENYLSVVNADRFNGRVATNYQNNTGATEGPWELLKIEIVPSAAEQAAAKAAAEKADRESVSEVAGLEKIDGLAHRIALGADNGKYLAMMVKQDDRKIYKMDSQTMGGWELVDVKDGAVVPAKFEDVALAADGTVGALAEDGSLFLSYDGGATWKNAGAPKDAAGKAIDMDRVAIASKRMIAVLDKESSDVFIYDHHDGSWDRIAHGQAMSISAGYPNLLLAINKNLDCYMLERKGGDGHNADAAKSADDKKGKGKKDKPANHKKDKKGKGKKNKHADAADAKHADAAKPADAAAKPAAHHDEWEWKELANPAKVGRFAIVDKEHMYGTVEKDGKFYLYQLDKGEWKPVLDAAGKSVQGIKEVVVNAGGAVMMMNIKGELSKLGVLDKEVHVAAARADKKHAADAAKPAGKKTKTDKKDEKGKKHAPAAKPAGKKTKTDKKGKKGEKHAGKKTKTDKKGEKHADAAMVDADHDGKPDAPAKKHKKEKKHKKAAAPVA